ncbi:tripeptidyl peptidase II [Fragilaria crotonensis]|nr:tripeptidyl peptidase II [Fragilaria crotonensis]
MDVTLQDTRADASDMSPRMIVLHAVQLLEHAPYSQAESRKYYNLTQNEKKVASLKVHGGVTCELAVARNWSAIGATKVNVQVEFRGVLASPSHIELTAGGGGACVRVSSQLLNEYISPSAKLNAWSTPIRPKSDGDCSISPLPDERDVIPSTNKRIYELILTYEFTQEEAGSVTPRAPALQGFLYESAYESQLMLLFDSEKKYLGVADAWPSEIKVPKGNVTVRMQVRHDNPDMLEKLKTVPIWIERKLEKELALSAYSSKESMMLGNGTFQKRGLRKGCSCAVFFAEPPSSKLPSGYKAGDILTGCVTFESSDTTLPGDGKRPGGYPITYMLASKPPKAKDPISTPEEKDERTVEEKLEEAVRICKIEYLGKLTKEEKDAGKFEEVYSSLEKEYCNHLPLLLEGLKHVDQEKKRMEQLQKVIDAADKIITQVSEDELALHFGKNHDKDDATAVRVRKEMTDKKMALCEAWARKAKAFADLDKGVEFDQALTELKKWVVLGKEDKFAVVQLEREKRCKRYGTTIKLLNSFLEKDCKGGLYPLAKADILTKRAEALEMLGYTMLVEYDKAWRVICSPTSYKLF